MKRGILYLVVFLSVFSIARAQSDYEIVEAFKDSLVSIRDSIESASSMRECDSLLVSLNALENDFVEYKTLLDQSLYPDDFNSSIEKLNSLIQLRRNDFSQIVELEDEIINLNRRNKSLISEIKFLQKKAKKDSETIASLKSLIDELKVSIGERDELVRTVIDSLLSDYVNRPLTLNESEKKEFIEKVETGNLIFNVQQTIRDNIQFLKVTRLTPSDLSRLKEGREEFLSLWSKIGPSIVNLYGDKQDTITEINIIDQLFDEWESEIDGKIWELVKYDYDHFDIPLRHFESGEQFVSSLTDHIEDEITNKDRKKVEEAEERYRLFVDSVWVSRTKAEWVPVLIENEMLSEEEVDSIDVRLEEWEAVITEPGIPFVYYLLVLIALIAMLFFIVKKVRSKKADDSLD